MGIFSKKRRQPPIPSPSTTPVSSLHAPSARSSSSTTASPSFDPLPSLDLPPTGSLAQSIRSASPVQFGDQFEDAYTAPLARSTLTLPRLPSLTLSPLSLLDDPGNDNAFLNGKEPTSSSIFGLSGFSNGETSNRATDPNESALRNRKSFDLFSQSWLDSGFISAPPSAVSSQPSSLITAPPRPLPTHPFARSTPSSPLYDRLNPPEFPALVARSSAPLLHFDQPRPPLHVPEQADRSKGNQPDERSPALSSAPSKSNPRRRFFGMFAEASSSKESLLKGLGSKGEQEPPSTRFEDLPPTPAPSSSSSSRLPIPASSIAPPGGTSPTPRPLPAHPPPSRPSTSFFHNPLRLSSNNVPTNSKPSTDDQRPPSPAESFRVISARRITTPGETSFPPTSISTASYFPTPPSVPSMLDVPGRTRGEDRSAKPRQTSYYSVFAPDDEEDAEEGGREERKMSAGAFRRRKSSMALEDLNRAAEDERGPGEKERAPMEHEPKKKQEEEEEDEDDRPLGMIKRSVEQVSSPNVGVGTSSPTSSTTRNEGFIVASRERRKNALSIATSINPLPETSAPSSDPVPSRPSFSAPLPILKDWVESPLDVDSSIPPYQSRPASPFKPVLATSESSLGVAQAASQDRHPSGFLRGLPAGAPEGRPSSEFFRQPGSGSNNRSGQSFSPMGHPERLVPPKRSSSFQPPIPVESRPIGDSSNAPSRFNNVSKPTSSPPSRPPSTLGKPQSAASASDSEDESEESEEERSSSDGYSNPPNVFSTQPGSKSPAASMSSQITGRVRPTSKPLISLQGNIPKPQLDRERSIGTRRASGSELDKLASASTQQNLRPPSFKPLPARRGSESVLSLANRSSILEIEEDSDGYGHDDDPLPAARSRKSFWTTRSVNELTEGAKVNKDEPAEEMDSDDDQPLGMLSHSLPLKQTPGKTPPPPLPLVNVILSSPSMPSVEQPSTGGPRTALPSRYGSNLSLGSSSSSTSSPTKTSTAPSLPPSPSTLRHTSSPSSPSSPSTDARPPFHSDFSTTAAPPSPFAPKSPEYLPSSPIWGNPPRPAFFNAHQTTTSPSSSCASGLSTGDSSSGYMPVTPREPSLVDVLKGRPVGARDGKPSGGKGVRIVQEREPLDEGEVEKRRNERRRNEARNAIKLGNIVNGPTPIEEEENADSSRSYHPPSDYRGGSGGPHQPAFPMYPPQGFFPYMPMMNDNPMMAFQMQVAMQAQQAQMAMQMAMAGQGDPNMQYNAMMMAKQQFQSMMAAQASQLAADQWETMSMHMGNGGAASEVGGPTYGNPSGMGYGGGYAASAYGGDEPPRWGAGPAMGGPSHAHESWSGSKSEYGGGSSSAGRRSRNPTTTQDGPSMSRSSFYENPAYGTFSAGSLPQIPNHPKPRSLSSTSRLVDQIPPHAARPRSRQPSFLSSHSAQERDGSTVPPVPPVPRQRPPLPDQPKSSRSRMSSAHSVGLDPPSAPFARERSPGARTGSPVNPPTAWRG